MIAEGHSLSESKTIKSWGAGCALQSLLAIIILLVVVVGIVGLVILTVLLPITDSQRISIWVGGLLLILFLIVGGIFVWSAHAIRRRAIKLDAAFNPLGLTGKAYLWNGRQYHGTLNGRQVDAYFYRGPSLAIYIASPLNTRLGIRLKGRLSQMASSMYNRPELVTTDPELAHLGIFPLDERWGRELLENSQAKADILRLTTTEERFEFRNLLFQPEAIQLQIHRFKLSTITAENLRIWVYDLLDLVGMAESLPAPHVTAVATILERETRLNRSGFTLPILGITCGVIGFFAIIITIIIILFFNLAKGGF
jgi:hypothetical protein